MSGNKNNIVSNVLTPYFVRCSCGVLTDTEQAQIMHYAYSHHNIEPLLEYHQAELTILRKEIQQLKENSAK